MNARQVLALLLLVAGGASAASAQAPCEESVYAIAEGNRIDLFHDGATFNCCPALENRFLIEGDRIVVTEIDWGLHPCRCFCCMDLAASIENVPAGAYTLELYVHHVLEDPVPVRVASIPVSVPGRVPAPLGQLEVLDFRRSGCLEEWPDESDPGLASTWGTLKILYR